MELLKKVILAACFLSAVLSMADAIRPKDKFSKQIKFIFSLIFIVGIGSAFSEFSFDDSLPISADVEGIEGYDSIEAAKNKVLKETGKEAVEDMVRGYLEAECVSYEKIGADVNITGDGSININYIEYSGNAYEQAVEAIKRNIGNAEVRKIDG